MFLFIIRLILDPIGLYLELVNDKKGQWEVIALGQDMHGSKLKSPIGRFKYKWQGKISKWHTALFSEAAWRMTFHHIVCVKRDWLKNENSI